MDFLNLVREARSCRRFDESSPLAFSDLEWLLECARATPCGKNAQQLRFITVSHGQVCKDLFALTRWAGALRNYSGPEPGERPTAFIAILMPEAGGEIVCFDTGITAQTIQLAATSRGWGACMLYSFDRKGATSLLNVPSGLKIALLIALGVATEKRVLDKMPADGSYAYWRDGDNVHHVPKRSIEELLIAKY